MVSPEYLHRRLMTLTSELHGCSLSAFDSAEHQCQAGALILEIAHTLEALSVRTIDISPEPGYSEPSNSVGNSVNGVCIHS